MPPLKTYIFKNIRGVSRVTFTVECYGDERHATLIMANSVKDPNDWQLVSIPV